jgi:hypothetical protein
LFGTLVVEDAPRKLYAERDEEVPLIQIPAQTRSDAATFKNHFFALLRTTRYANIDVTIKSRDPDATTEDGGMHRDLGVMVKIGPLAAELFGGCHANTNKQVASLSAPRHRRVTSSRNPDNHTVLHACSSASNELVH